MTNAEKQRKYWERKKLEKGSEYLKKETERIKKYYIPATRLSLEGLGRRRKRSRDYTKKFRDSKSKNDKNNPVLGRCNPDFAGHELNNNLNLSKNTVKINFCKNNSKFD